jgi:hypothetical protein
LFLKNGNRPVTRKLSGEWEVFHKNIRSRHHD